MRGSGLSLQEGLDKAIDEVEAGKIRDLTRETARFRSVKSEREQVLMRKAADVSGVAHTKVRGDIFFCAGEFCL